MTTMTEGRTRTSAARPHVTVLTDRCAGCQECLIRCPTAAVSMDSERWVVQVDDSLCTGCRQCERTCPFSAIQVEGPLIVEDRLEIKPTHPLVLLDNTTEVRPGLPNWAAVLAEANRCLNCPDPTCVRGCPAHNDIPSFIQAIRSGDLNFAHDVLSRTSVLPDICSRVCDQSTQCEGACTWSLAGGEPVAIGALERFVCDNAAVRAPTRRSQAGGGISVGIIGSGPAGIGAAWELIEAGASVTVYEKDAEPGGLLRWGIPDFTLPAAVARRPWEQLQAMGVDLRCGFEVAAEDLDRLMGAHDAVIVANGASLPLRLPVQGLDLNGVTDATTFLQLATGALADGRGSDSFQKLYAELPVLSQATPRVLVIGAGNTGMDVARTARRLGAEAICIDWLDRRFAIVRPDELSEAIYEGVQVCFSTTLLRLEGESGLLRRAWLAKTRQGRAAERPKVLTGKSESVPVDLAVMAMGYRNDPSFSSALPGTPVRRETSGLPDRRWMASGILAGPASEFAHHQPVGTLALGREVGLSAAASPVKDRLWVVGDALVGPSTVVEAMAQGRRAGRAVLLTRREQFAF